jgi:hypothetical protein
MLQEITQIELGDIPLENLQEIALEELGDSIGGALSYMSSFTIQKLQNY